MAPDFFKVPTKADVDSVLDSEETKEAKAILDRLIEYNWGLITAKIKDKGLSYEEAFEEWRVEMLAESAHDQA